MGEFYTSDQHFCHKNAPKLMKNRQRFMDNITAMNEEQIENWNATVTMNDTVHLLGDVGMGNVNAIVECVRRLNGKIKIYPGNHDEDKLLRRLAELPRVEIMPLYVRRRMHGTLFYIGHIPIEIGFRPHVMNIHGHLHDVPSTQMNQINVGVDAEIWQDRPFGAPIPLDELMEYVFKVQEEMRELKRKKREEEESE